MYRNSHVFIQLSNKIKFSTNNCDLQTCNHRQKSIAQKFNFPHIMPRLFDIEARQDKQSLMTSREMRPTSKHNCILSSQMVLYSQ